MGGLGDVLTYTTNIYLILFRFYLSCRWVGIKLELRASTLDLRRLRVPVAGRPQRGRAENLSAGRSLGQQGTI